MDSHSIGLIIAIVILIIGSAYFSATETAFTSLNKISLKSRANKGDKKASSTLALAEDYDRNLTTILIGNNIINIISTSLSTILFVNIFPQTGVLISTIVMTILVLIFGEITPKSLAKENAESFAIFSTPILKMFRFILIPLIYIFGLWTKLVNKLFAKKGNSAFSEEELLTIVTEAESGGGIDEHESKLITAAIEFNDVDVTDILTPRVDLSAIDEEDSAQEIEQQFLRDGYSRLPVYRNTIDNIIGVITQKAFYAWCKKCEKSGNFDNISTIISPVKYINESTKISGLLRQLQKERTHLAVVIDEFGGTVGIVTLEDIIEELVGDIYDEHDKNIQPDFVRSAKDNAYIIDSGMAIDDMMQMLNIKIDDDEYESTTVGGWVSEILGHIGRIGESFTYCDYTITILNADNRKVKKIEIIQKKAENEQQI